jgi:hypothetical protein
MSEMNGVPVALSYALNRVNGVSVNSFQINSTTASDVLPNSQIRFLLPTAGMLDFKTLRLNFAVELPADTKGARLPAGIKHLFQRVQVMVGGVVIAQGTNFFGVQEDAIGLVSNNEPDTVTEHGKMAISFDYAGLSLQTKEADESYATGLGSSSTLFSCDLGDIAKISPRIVPLDLMSQIEIIFYTAPTSVLSAVLGSELSGGTNTMTKKATTNGTNVTYTIKRATLNANMYSLDDGAFSMAVASRIRDVGFAELCFPQHLAFSQQWNGSARFALSAMSLNKLHAVWRRNTGVADDTAGAFGTIGGAVQVAGYAQTATNAGAQYGWLGGGNLNKAGQAEFRGRCQTYSAPFETPAFNATTNDGDAYNYSVAGATELRLQFKINSAQVPQYQANQTQWLSLTNWANNVESSSSQSLCENLFNKYVISYPLELPHEAYEKKTISGLDTRASNTFISLEGTGNVDTAGNFDCLILAEVSSLVRVGAGKSLELLM